MLTALDCQSLDILQGHAAENMRDSVRITAKTVARHSQVMLQQEQFGRAYPREKLSVLLASHELVKLFLSEVLPLVMWSSCLFVLLVHHLMILS